MGASAHSPHTYRWGSCWGVPPGGVNVSKVRLARADDLANGRHLISAARAIADIDSPRRRQAWPRCAFPWRGGTRERPHARLGDAGCGSPPGGQRVPAQSPARMRVTNQPHGIYAPSAVSVSRMADSVLGRWRYGCRECGKIGGI